MIPFRTLASFRDRVVIDVEITATRDHGDSSVIAITTGAVLSFPFINSI